VRFYEKCDFLREDQIPLRRHQDGERVSYKPLAAEDSAKPDKYFQRMVYRPKPQRPQQWPSMILTAGPSISEREAVYALDAARHGWNNEWSKYLKRFEQEFANYVGVKHALATSCCTGALHLSLLALGIGPGDEVIVPDSTWVATANAVLYTGATPVFADVQAASWCLDPGSFESLITPRTKAVMPVHMYGHPAEMDAIMSIARKHGLAVVEDAAPSIGAEYKGRRTGTFGDFACFSFQGAKLMVTGEGGMLLTNDDALYAKAHKIWDQGRQPGGFWIDANGWKYKMSNIQAALGVGQLAHVDLMIAAKRRIADWYNEGLKNVPGISFWREASWARSIYWMSSIMVEEGCRLNRDALRDALKKRIPGQPSLRLVSIQSGHVNRQLSQWLCELVTVALICPAGLN
jgi:perosamine synthetase